jgi:hypothetical protein
MSKRNRTRFLELDRARGRKLIQEARGARTVAEIAGALTAVELAARLAANDDEGDSKKTG